ncbi:AKT2 [Symbiodinium natans]|uniref:AKT2 protein n=1 Tax=Symbiodinium natans TaxID=878477 RepID=A0A812K781_9DINO|nr:AKT2 [Symbiodinium natans]
MLRPKYLQRLEPEGLRRRLQALQDGPEPVQLDDEGLSLTKEALRAFAHGALATWAQELQTLDPDGSRGSPSRCLAQMEDKLQKMQEIVSASAGDVWGRIYCWQSPQGPERLRVAALLLANFEQAVRDGRTLAWQELSKLHRSARWKAMQSHAVEASPEHAHKACAESKENE